MTKKDLVNEVARRSNMDVVQVEKVINQTLTVTKESIIKGSTLYLRGFGTMGHKIRAAKKGRNIKKGEIINIPAKRIPFFRPCNVFKQETNIGREITENEF